MAGAAVPSRYHGMATGARAGDDLALLAFSLETRRQTCGWDNFTTSRPEREPPRRPQPKQDDMTGKELKREDLSEVDVERYWETFQALDIDSSGFISPDNMLEVLHALGLEVTMDVVASMIEEVAQLTGHGNDGQVSFRDFMSVIQHDRAGSKAVQPEDEPSPVGQTTTSEPELRARTSSMGALSDLAASRIKAFQHRADEAAAQREKLSMFKKAPPMALDEPMVNSDDMHLESLASKLKAFEIAATFKGKTELKRTWKKADGAGNYRGSHKILLCGVKTGIAPKKKLSDLP